jgi:hypothetical protein
MANPVHTYEPRRVGKRYTISSQRTRSSHVNCTCITWTRYPLFLMLEMLIASSRIRNLSRDRYVLELAFLSLPLPMMIIKDKCIGNGRVLQRTLYLLKLTTQKLNNICWDNFWYSGTIFCKIISFLASCKIININKGARRECQPSLATLMPKSVFWREFR